MAEDVKTAETNEEVTTVAADEESTIQATVDTQPPESATQSTPEAKEEPRQKPVQTDRENAEYARARRERERQAAIEKASADAVKAERVKNIVELVKTNPFTNKPIKTAEDVDQYLLMKRIDADGGEPLQDYAAYVDKKAREAEEAKQQAELNKAHQDSDIQDFKKAHPEVKLEELLIDKTFIQLYGDSVGSKPLNTLYSDYQSFMSEIREQEKAKLVAQAAKANSGVGPVSTPQSTPEITLAQFKRMDIEARQKLYNDNPGLYRELTKK